MTALEPYVARAVNLARDPSLESGLAGIGLSNNGALYPAAWDTVTKYTGTRANMLTRTATTPSNTIGSAMLTPPTQANGGVVPVTPGDVLSFAAYLRASVPWRGQISLQWRTNAGANLGTSAGPVTAVLPANTWVRVATENVVAIAGSERVAVVAVTLLPAGQSVGGEQSWQDALMVTAGAVAEPYFDGSAAGCAWSGTPSQSQSVRAQQTPWALFDGLTEHPLDVAGQWLGGVLQPVDLRDVEVV